MVGQETLGGGCKCVKDMKVGGSNHVQLEESIKWKGEKVLHVHDQRGLGKCKVGAPHSHEGLGSNKGN
jgi:hypothetical protein